MKIIVPNKKDVRNTKELLEDSNKKINSENTKDIDKTRTLLTTHKKITNKLLIWNIKLFIMFLFDILLLLIDLTIFIWSMFDDQKWMTIFMLSISSIIFIKFTIMNWFAKNLYFKKIVVFKYNSKVDKHKFRASREISFTPIWFWIFFVASNFIIVVLVNYIIQGIIMSFSDVKWHRGSGILLFWAICRAMIDMMLLPSFINSFGKIANTNKDIDSKYVKVIKDQYFSNKSLFEDVEFEENYLHLRFNKNNLTSRNGLFIFINKDDLTRPDQTRMKEINKEILARYKEIWESYIDLLENRMKTKFGKTSTHKLYWLERIYDKIFLDVFDI